MFKVVTLFLGITISILFLGLTSHNYYFDSKPGYVGTKVCGMCHKKEDVGQQFKIWELSKHAQAYKTLKTEKADKVAKEKGFKTKAIETKECLKCHASGFDVNKSLLGEKFSIEDGVQCESCHGPGSEYKSKKVMEDRKLAVENGLILYDKPEEFCIKCHNEESPFYKPFNFKEMWAKIKHNKPK